MPQSKVRQPQQQRSIEKKKRILEAGLKLFLEKGYHRTNTAQIAKEAKVSTGIVYNYYENKKDILMECLEIYAGKVAEPIYEMLEDIKAAWNTEKIVTELVDHMIESHHRMKTAHHEMEAIAYTDPDVGKFFKNYEEELIQKLAEIFKAYGFNHPHLHEKIHIIYNMVEDLCHETAFHGHAFINYQVMREEVIRIIVRIINEM